LFVAHSVSDTITTHVSPAPALHRYNVLQAVPLSRL
jgi:hypothetical protein